MKDRAVEIFGLQEDVEKYKRMANIEYVKSLEMKITDLKELVSEQEEDYKVLAKKNEEMSNDLVSANHALMEEQIRCAEQ